MSKKKVAEEAIENLTSATDEIVQQNAKGKLATGGLIGGAGIGGGAILSGAGEGVDEAGNGALKLAVGLIVAYIVINNVLDINIGDKL